VPPFLVLLVNAVVALALITVGSIVLSLRGFSRQWAIGAALPLLSATLLAAFVFGEDSYRGNGISRWEAYRSPGGALGPMFFLSIAVMSTTAALLAHSGLRGRRGVFAVTTFTAGLACLFLVIPTIVGFSTN
jgi:cell division protein FtsW (lipid II flippase)